MMVSMVEQMLMQLAGTVSSGFLRDPAFLTLMFWVGIPGSIFGEPAFRHSMFFGIVPEGYVGWLMTVLFWIGASVFLWSVTLLFRRKATHAKAEQAVPPNA